MFPYSAREEKEQQSRPPPVTVEQIRELILEQRDRCNRRRGRPRERDHHYDEEEEWTDNSTWSWDSQSQPQQTDGGNDQSFCDVEEGIHLNKLEFQPETELKVCETAVKVVTEKMRVLCTTEENNCAPTPALQSRTPPLNVVRSTTTLVRQVAPPKPPVSKNFQIIEAPGNGSLAKLPPSSQSLTTDSGAEISPPPQATPAKMTSRSTEQIDLTSVEKNLERRRAKKWQYKDVKALEVLQMLTYAIAKWAFTCEYAWHAGKKIGVHIFIPNHYVGTLKDINVTKELSRPVVVSMGVGNSNLIRIDCWLKQHNNKVILSTCDAIQSGAIKQLWALAIIFQTYVLKKGHAKDLVGVAKEACQQASHNGLDVVLVDIAERRHDYEYFICDNMLEFNSSLKDMDKIGGQPMLVKKLLNPTMDSKNRENGIAPAAIVFHLTIFSIKDVVCDFIMLLDFVEETPLDILITDKYSGPSDVKKLRLKMMTAVANESNTGEMVTEQREYDANADIPIARKSIWVVVKMVLQQYDVKVVVVPLIQFLEMERGYFISKALMFATMILNSSVRIIPWDPGKFNVFKAKVDCECCWRKSYSIYGLLNWVYGKHNHFQPLPTSLNEEWQLKPEPEEALDTRRNASGEVEVLVTRKGLLGVENSWELADKMRKEFPRFLLEVKENFEGGGIDSYDRFYKRKRGQKDTANHSLIGMFPYSAREEKVNLDLID
ncbi:unnamed protein product [Trifolium pratense]|uniref:Uncharacterized protein n=1 Tax=Trifolium pratense TaxID=57577 RepID=A0ACB0JN40_TRIPR|nr:unnamed protein product [Trifolium pratense]